MARMSKGRIEPRHNCFQKTREGLPWLVLFNSCVGAGAGGRTLPIFGMLLWPPLAEKKQLAICVVGPCFHKIFPNHV